MNPDRLRPTRPSSAAIRFVSLFLILIGMVALAAVAYFSERGITVSRDWVVRAYHVRAQLNDLQLQITRAQAAETGSLQTHNQVEAGKQEQFNSALHKVDALRKLTLDNPRQQKRLDDLSHMLKVSLLTGSHRIAGEMNRTNLRATRQELSDHQRQIDDLVRGMQDEEESILEQRLQDWEYLFKRNVLMLGLAFAAVGVVLVYNIWELLAELMRRKKVEDQIRENEKSYRVMSAKILESQDLERRRISRELHDSVGQYLAGLKINLSQLKPDGRVDPAALIRDTIAMTDCALQEVRTMSHLLHPPLLEELGFLPAARWYLDEYGKRSQLKVALVVDGSFNRLPREIELALFRVLQEALANVNRHAAARSVQVRLACDDASVTMSIADDGRGIPGEILSRFRHGSAPGIGLGGMRERLAEFGGAINIESSVSGSVVKATIPTSLNWNPAGGISKQERPAV